MTRVELVTSSLPRKRSTTELHRLKRAGDGARTRHLKLGRLSLYQMSYSRLLICSLSSPWLRFEERCGERRIRTSEGFANRFTVCPI